MSYLAVWLVLLYNRMLNEEASTRHMNTSMVCLIAKADEFINLYTIQFSHGQ